MHIQDKSNNDDFSKSGNQRHIVIIIIIKTENSYNLDMSIAASYVKNPFLFFLGMGLDYIFLPLLRISTAIWLSFTQQSVGSSECHHQAHKIHPNSLHNFSSFICWMDAANPKENWILDDCATRWKKLQIQQGEGAFLTHPCQCSLFLVVSVK